MWILISIQFYILIWFFNISHFTSKLVRVWSIWFQAAQWNSTSLGRVRLALSWWRHQMETFSTLLAFVQGIHQWPVNSPHKGLWRRALSFSLICVWVNNREAGDWRRHRAHYDVTVMIKCAWLVPWKCSIIICPSGKKNIVSLTMSSLSLRVSSYIS